MDALKSYESDSEESGSSDVEENVAASENVGYQKKDYLGIRGIEPSHRTEDINKPKELDSSDNKSEKSDFFGIFSTEKRDSVKGVTEKFDPESLLKKSVKVDNEVVSVEVPGSSFWSGVSESDIKVHQRTERSKCRKVERHDNFTERKRAVHSERNYPSFTKKMKVHEFDQYSVNEVKKDEKLSDTERRKIYFIHSKITPFLHCKKTNCRLPSKKEWDSPGHGGAVNRIKWNIPNYSHLLVTCSMDTTIKVWNVWSQLDPCVQVLRVHSKAVRDVALNRDGKQLLSCSYDKSAVISDIERGVILSRHEHSSFVTCGKYHPVNHHVCVTGSNNQLQVWDTRTPSTQCRTLRYKDNIGQVQDIVMTGDGSTVFSCSDLVSRDSADRNLMAWDFRSGTVMSNQIYQERFTLTRLHLHPTENQLLAQSNGNYIALFSLQSPYKMNKHKRFDGHKLQGYNIGFDVSPDGQMVYSGSSDGKLHCYDYRSGKHLRSVDTGQQVVMDVASHPVLHSTVAISSWDGTVQVWK